MLNLSNNTGLLKLIFPFYEIENLMYFALCSSICYSKLHTFLWRPFSHEILWCSKFIFYCSSEFAFDDVDELLSAAIHMLREGVELFQSIRSTPNVVILQTNLGMCFRYVLNNMSMMTIFGQKHFKQKFHQEIWYFWEITLKVFNFSSELEQNC